jgi:hypothetical protein
MIRAGEMFLVTDATASRKVFYCRKDGGVYCASQPHLLAATLQLEITRDPSRLSFYGSNEFRRLNNANIGNTTCYDGVFQLTANHYLDYINLKCIRFWPNQKSSVQPFKKVVDISAAMIKGYINSIGHRYKLMLPVTGGKDSRLLLSATADISDQVYYYINKDPKAGVKSYDVEIPKTLLPKLGLDFHVLIPDQQVDPDFRKVYFENNPYANEAFLPIIYNYHANFSDRVNLPGTFVNVVEDVYEVFCQKITPRVLAELIHIERFDYAEEYFTDWLNGCEDLCRQLNFNVLNLLYWEERVANWGTQLQLDKDIAQDDIIPYNSRLLMQTMLSADLKYREKPDFYIFTEITRALWPETLQAPCNPDIKMDVLKISKRLGLMKALKNLYYRYIH